MILPRLPGYILLLVVSLYPSCGYDPCTIQNNWVSEGKFQNICQQCVQRNGCVFDLTLLTCRIHEPSKRHSNTPAGIQHGLNVSYCSLGQPSCNLCKSTVVNPICRGMDGCVCQEICTLLDSNTSLCCSPSKTRQFIWCIVGGGCLMIALIFWLQMRWNLLNRRLGPTNEPHSRSHSTVSDNNEGLLELTGWRQQNFESLRHGGRDEMRNIKLNAIDIRAEEVLNDHPGDIQSASCYSAVKRDSGIFITSGHEKSKNDSRMTRCDST
ncbi:hypothetical protein ABG067_002157 [Albugo candida]